MRSNEMAVRTLFLPLVLLGMASVNAAAQDAPAQPPQPPAPAEPSRVVTGDRTIERGEVIDEIVVVDGDLRIRGEVTGNVMVVGGDLILEESGVVGGDAIVRGGGELLLQGGRIVGEMRTLDGNGPSFSGDIGVPPIPAIESPAGRGERVRAATVEVPRRRNDGFFSGSFRRGFAGIMSTLALGLVLAGIGSILVFYGRPYLETVSDTIRSSVPRAGATGLAASFLAVPAFVVLIVALAVSIIGIPFLLVAVPLYPIALFASAVFGLLAVAHAIGERTAEQSREGLDFRHRNSYAYLFTGLGMVLTPLLAANLLQMTGFLGFLGTLLQFLTWLAIWVACTIGFGAVILSRAGTRRTFVTPTPDAGAIDTDDFFGDEPLSRSGNA
jgi:hypothetical protein